ADTLVEKLSAYKNPLKVGDAALSVRYPHALARARLPASDRVPEAFPQSVKRAEIFSESIHAVAAETERHSDLARHDRVDRERAEELGTQSAIDRSDLLRELL